MLATQYPALSVFATFFVSSSPPFKMKFTYASLKNDFSRCQLNPVPTGVLFLKKKTNYFYLLRWLAGSYMTHVLRNKQNKEDLLHNLIEGN